jgi:hypothetical protein
MGALITFGLIPDNSDSNQLEIRELLNYKKIYIIENSKELLLLECENPRLRNIDVRYRGFSILEEIK